MTTPRPALAYADAIMTALGEHQRATRPAREAVATEVRRRTVAGEDYDEIMIWARARLKEIDLPFDEKWLAYRECAA